jgi:hypothetical protein
MHVMCGFFHTDITTLLFVFVLTTVEAKCKVLTQSIVTVGQIDSQIDILLIVVSISPTALALEAMLTLPLLWYMRHLWLQAKTVIWSITPPTKIQFVFIRCLPAKFTAFAIQTFPIRLVHFLYLVRCQL